MNIVAQYDIYHYLDNQLSGTEKVSVFYDGEVYLINHNCIAHSIQSCVDTYITILQETHKEFTYSYRRV